MLQVPRGQDVTQECLDQYPPLQQADVPGAQLPGSEFFYTNPHDPTYYEYTMYYKLPDTLICDGETSYCVIQWYWLTGNTCNPPAAPQEYRRPYNLPDCDTPEASSPEEFWNCMDVVIRPPGNGSVVTKFDAVDTNSSFVG